MAVNPRNELEVKRRLALELEKKIQLQRGLPHLHGWKWYPWARKFFESTNHYNFLCAANQISKSSTQIRKAIHWATEPAIWTKLWRSRPLQFWYLYPAKNVATIEFEKKWKPHFMPREEFKDHPQYGWREEYKNKEIFAVHFNTGVSIYFKTYGQDVNDLQTGTVDALFCDEELPENLFSELNMRIAASEGYFHMVFTATIGQEMWRETMEEVGTKDERFVEAFKLQVSMFDCLVYEDGSLSHWTQERIQRVINSCKDTAEVQRRVFGRFVVSEGRKYPGFDRTRNKGKETPPKPIPGEWLRYGGVDIGGGGDGHPAAICFVAVNPTFTKARVYLGWRGDNETTTAADVYHKFKYLQGSTQLAGQFFDWQAKDFGTIATRMGDPFTPAEKSHEIGEQVLNVLFKNGLLEIDDVPELRPLIHELMNLRRDTPKNKAKDDFADALRYTVTRIPWNWALAIGSAPLESDEPKETPEEQHIRERREAMGFGDQLELAFGAQEELDAFNELLDV